MKSSKILILVFTLSFPVILYLFLTFYGSNEFDLPVYFEDKNELCDDFQPIESINSTLISSNQEAYLLQDILQGTINIVHFPDLTKDNQQLKNELSRLLLTFSNEENIKMHALYNSESKPSASYVIESDNKKIFNYELEPNFYPKLLDCYLMLPTQKWADQHPADMILEENSTLVLIDQNARIRGYYDGLETKDVDRLILEIRILMTKINK